MAIPEAPTPHPPSDADPTRLMSGPPSGVSGVSGDDSEFTPTRLMASRGASDHHDTDASVARLAALRSLAPGDELGEYLLIERIGSGGMGEVWRAAHRRLERTVAIKVMLHQSRAAWARFEREARLAAGLDHPHIAKLYEFSLDPPFIAMQHIEGAALHRTGCDRIHALRDAALAVHHAHERGVLHRDLKPDNILVDAQGCAFVVDFGLARPVDDEHGHLTMTGDVVGTPAFMAPEQARGITASMDARTDVYGLGATLYALISGHPPFSGSSTWETLRLVVDEDPPRPGGDRDLETICLTAMAKDRSRRYASAQDFADELTRALAHEPVLARRAGAAYRIKRSIQRRPAVWSLTALLALAVIMGAGFGVIKLVDAQVNLARALQAEQERARTEAERSRDLALQGLVDAARRETRELDDTLARELTDAELATARTRLDTLIAGLRRERAARADEGILAYLCGEAELLRNQEDTAIADFTAAIAAAQGPVSRASGTRGLACQGRAMARLRRDFFDQMARLFVFHNQGGYFAADAGGTHVVADLDAAGTIGDAYERQVLALWVRYVRAFKSADIYREYVATHADAQALAARGGRRNEALFLLVGVLTPFPRDLDQVVATYSSAIDRCHGFPQAWVMRALERSSNGRLADARADLDHALRLKPDYAVARLMRAGCHGDSPEGAAAALADLDEAVRLADQEPMCWYTRGQLYRRGGRAREAFADLTTASERGSALTGFRQQSAMWSALGDFHRQLGRRAEAIAAYRSAAAAGDVDASLMVARLLAEDGDAGAAEREIAALLTDGPVQRGHERGRCEARMFRASLRDQAGDRDGALADFQWVITQVPTYTSARMQRAALLRRLDRLDEAMADLDAAVAGMRAWATQATGAGWDKDRVGGRVADALAARARARIDAGDLAAAAIDCDEALTLSAGHAEALRARALVQRGKGNMAEAEADDRQAADQLISAGDRLRGQGDYRDAIDRYQLAAAIGSDDRARAGLFDAARLQTAALAELGGAGAPASVPGPAGRQDEP
ncbi:MAG: protein kinase [Planctomycetes bacterium]|nr:protein kinase [Planctomycetota bacterium]